MIAADRRLRSVTGSRISTGATRAASLKCAKCIGTAPDRNVKVQVEVHPNNPTAVGRHSWLSADTIATRYHRISR